MAKKRSKKFQRFPILPVGTNILIELDDEGVNTSLTGYLKAVGMGVPKSHMRLGDRIMITKESRCYKEFPPTIDDPESPSYIVTDFSDVIGILHISVSHD